MRVPVVDAGLFTGEDFQAFTGRRSDEEKWEPVDGDLILNASPANFHRRIAADALFPLTAQLRARPTEWTAIPGIGARVSNTEAMAEIS
jgi:hypothetical protein